MTSNLTTATHTPGPWRFSTRAVQGSGDITYIKADTDHIEIAVIYYDENQPANARLIVAAPDLLDDARKNDAAFTWLAEQMNSITDNAKHWTVGQIEALAQDLRIGIEYNQTRTRAAIAKAEGL